MSAVAAPVAPAFTSPWIDSPFFPRLLAESGHQADDARLIRDFAENGYVYFDPQIPSAQLETARENVSGLYRPGAGPSYSDERRVQDAWLVSTAVREIAIAPRVMSILRMLYRREPVPFQTLNFRIGTEQATHSDTIHFHCFPSGYMCGVWVALEDVDGNNGPLHYYPGSQKLPIFDLSHIGIAGSSQSFPYELYWKYEEFVRDYLAQLRRERMEVKMERGQALIWAANLFHGGSPIRDTARTRHSQVTHYFFEDCFYYTPLMSDPMIGKVFARKTYDIAKSRIAPQTYNGQRVLNPGEWPPKLAPSVD